VITTPSVNAPKRFRINFLPAPICFVSFDNIKNSGINEKVWIKFKQDTFAEVNKLIDSMHAFVIEKKDDF
jgi:hypothetical protein